MNWVKRGLAAVVITLFASCSGPTGPQGSQGPKGDTGATGAKGDPGAKGDTGATGNTGSNGTNGTNGLPGTTKQLWFSPVNVALSTTEKQSVVSTLKARVNGTDVPVSYVTELRSGDSLGGNVFGRITMIDGGVVKNADGSDLVSNYSDFSSILKVGTKLFEVTHFEAIPGAMYLSELNQATDGKLTITSTKPIDFSAFGGIWDPCAGSVSPWGTHLGSEEYPGDGRAYETGTDVATVVGGSFNTGIVKYYGLEVDAGVAAVKSVFNPYRYGWITEISVDANGTPTVKKHFAAGRRALELAYVMPDQKTVYLTDDGTNDGLYMFVAKTAGDLSEGRLYAARWYQTSPVGAAGATADIYWLELGSNLTDSQVRAWVEGGTKFSDLFETAGNNPDGGTACEDSTFRSINADTGRECLRLKPDAGDVASRLESRRYAAYVGATTEFRKSEGITYNPELGRLYVSFSEINNGMLDNNARDLGGPNHIAMAQNYCGGVYEFVLAPNTALGSGYAAESARPLVLGIPLASNGGAGTSYPTNSPYFDSTATAESGAATLTNVCSVSGIANPDNISYLPGYNTLMIGEDTTIGHQNDVLWSYDLISGELTRIFSTPLGSEVTGTYWYPNLNGKAYLKVQVQHPYVESDPEKAPNAAARQSYVGYIGPFPPLD